MAIIPSTIPPNTARGISAWPMPVPLSTANTVIIIIMVSISLARRLNFDVHNFLNDQGAKHLHPQSEQAHLDAGRVRPKHFHIVRLDVEHDQEQNERQSDQDHAAESAFRGKGLHLSQNSIAL